MKFLEEKKRRKTYYKNQRFRADFSWLVQKRSDEENAKIKI